MHLTVINTIAIQFHLLLLQHSSRKMLLVRNLFRISRRNISALYVTGVSASEHCSILVPHMDFADKLKNRQHLEENLLRRRLLAAHNLDELYQYYDLYTTITQRLTKMEQRRQEITTAVEDLKKTDPKNSDLFRKYKEESTALKTDYKQLKHQSYAIDDKFVHQFLALPNDIDARTPDEAAVLVTHGEPTTREPQTDLRDVVDYFDETAFYLEKDAAKFDLLFPMYWIDRLREHGYIQFSNPDFAKSILVEGAGVPQTDVYGIKEEAPEDDLHLLHLVGSGSMISYLGYISRLVVEPRLFPLKFICTGKQYVPRETNSLGLYGVSQSTAIQMFCAGKVAHIDQHVDDVLKIIHEIFLPFGLHYRVVQVPAHELQLAECWRIRVEMFSRAHNQYVEVGNLSSYSDFISKRLLFNYKEDAELQFPHVISGTLCNVTRLIGLLLEQNGQSFRLPDFLEKYANE